MKARDNTEVYNHSKEQEHNWNRYYSWLDADRLLKVTTNCFFYGTPTGQVVNDRLVPGSIWLSQLTHRQRPEPANEKLNKAIEKLYSEGRYSKPLYYLMQGNKVEHRTGWERYQEYNNKNDDPLGGYIVFHPLVLKRIYELTEPILYGQREDVQGLVKQYHDGNNEVLQRIIKQLGGLISKAEKEFSYTGDKEIFTNLAGEFSSYIPKPEEDYSEDSPAGDTEDQRLLLTTEPFKFTEVDFQITIEKAVIDALDSYRFNQGTQFTTWFYRIFKSDLLDLYREYIRNQGGVIKTLEEYEKVTADRLEHDPYLLNDYFQDGFLEQLNYREREWLKLQLKVQPNRLRRNVAAKVLSVSNRQERRYKEGLIDLILTNGAVFKKWKRLIVRDIQPRQPVRKEPTFNNRQLGMLKHYNEFTNRKMKNGKYIRKPLPVNPDEFKYKPGICKEGSFFPVNHIIEPIKEKPVVFMPVPQIDEYTQERFNVRNRISERRIIGVTQHISLPKKYCNCGMILTTTGECINTIMCPYYANNLMEGDKVSKHEKVLTG